MDDIHYRRLRWMANANPGDSDPELFPLNNWGPALSDTAQAALDEIARLNKELSLVRKDT
jgi:hypothetical protein